MIRSILTLALFPALVACTTAPAKVVVPDVPVIAPKTTVNVPAGLIATCPPLTMLDESKGYSQGDSLDVIAAWAAQYELCASRFEKYVSLTGKALNINEVPASNGTDASK